MSVYDTIAVFGIWGYGILTYTGLKGGLTKTKSVLGRDSSRPIFDPLNIKSYVHPKYGPALGLQIAQSR